MNDLRKSLLLATTFPLALAVACGDEAQRRGVPVTSEGDAGGDAADAANTDGGPSLPSLAFEQVSLKEHADDVPCSGAVGAPNLARVALAQTHLMTPDWPLFYLSGDRPALLFVDVTGVGASPEISVEAKSAGTSLGKKCLKGPAELPASLDPAIPDREKSFTVTLPAQWIKQGVELTIRAGTALRVLSPSELKVGPSPVGTLLTANFLFFGDTEGHPRADIAREYLSKTPFSHLNVGHLPIDLTFPKFVVAPDSITGTDAAGSSATSPVQWATKKASCTQAEKTAKTCTGYGAFGFIIAVRNLMGEIQKANGLGALAFAYGDISPKAGCEGAGLGGGRLGAGGNYGLVFNHEMGHGFGLPHWGDITPPRATLATNTYPYAGEYLRGDGQVNGGGFGRTWGYDPLDGTLISPICAANGKELHDPMQRHGDCSSEASLKPGQKFDFYSDFSAWRIYRLLAGGAAVSGTLAYHGASVPFGAPDSFPNPEWADPTKPDARKWNGATGSYVAFPDEGNAALPIAVDQPAYLVYGTFHVPSDTLSAIYAPILYRGNLTRLYDPTNAADFDAMKGNYLAYYGWDLTVRAEYEDGTIRHALLRTSVRGDAMNDPLSGDSLKYFAVNLPADKRLKKATLLYKPFATRPKGGVVFPGDIVNDASVTPANVLVGAREAASAVVP